MPKVIDALWRISIPRSPVFTTRSVASDAGVSADQASRDLRRLARRGLIIQVIPGVWAATLDSRYSAYAAVPALLRLIAPRAMGYVSLLSAMNLHGMVQQIPRAIQVVVGQRVRATRRTPAGTFHFYTMSPDLVGGFGPYKTGTFDIATPEKALFDLLYLSTRRGTRFRHLPELGLPRTFSVASLQQWINSIAYPSLRTAVARRWAIVQQIIEATRLEDATGE